MWRSSAAVGQFGEAMTIETVKPKCQQKGCERTANTRMFWPGQPAALVCIPCAAKAQKLADAMGFVLDIEEARE